MLKTKERNLPTCTNRSEEQVEFALAAFGNQAINRRFLAEDTMSTLLPESDCNPHQRKIWKGMQDVFTEMRSARRFSKTYVGHMLSETSIPALIADELAREVGSNTVAGEVSLVESRLEIQTMGALIDMIGYNRKEASGTFCSGGSMANMTALAVARKEMETKYEKANKKFPDEVWVLATDMAHYSIPKAVDLLGGPQHVIKIKTIKTEGMKMSKADLKLQVAEAKRLGIPIMAIVAVMGETETGLVDDGKAISKIAKENGIFSIADGAYGAPYIMSRVGDKFSHLKDFDATVVDVHKCFYTPYGGGVVLFRDSMQHAGLARGVMANYIGNSAAKSLEEFEKQRPEIARDFNNGTARLGAKRLEGSMSAAAILSTKATWDTLGKEGLGTIYDLTLDRINHLHERLRQSEILRPYHDPELNLLCFTLKDEILEKFKIDKYSDNFSKFIHKTRTQLDNNIKGEGGYYFSDTNLPDENKPDPNKPGTFQKVWTWRACIMNPWTTDEIIDDAIGNLEIIIKDKLGIN